MNKKSVLVVKSYNFAVRIVRLYQYIVNTYKEYIISRQILKSGTSIGANINEAQAGQTKKDFNAKIYISLKEAKETEYWLNLLKDTEYINQEQFNSIEKDLIELLKMLTSTTKTLSKDS